jgi:predicted transposase/invertase (TIGR01784 family)
MAQKRRQAAGLSSSHSSSKSEPLPSVRSEPLSNKAEKAYPEEMALRIINDYIFKYVFGREETKDILLDLVNAVLEDAGWPRARSLTLGNPAQGRSGNFLKETVLDIRVEDEHDRQFDIEIQVSSNPYFVNRSLFYWAQLYGNQLDRGLAYGRLRPVICVNILAFTIFSDLPGRHNWFMLRNAARPDYVLTEDLVLHYIELYKTEAGTAGQDSAGLAPVPTRLQAWIELLRQEREGEDMKVLLRDDLIFQKAHEAFQWCTHDRESRELALSRERFLRDQASNLEFALEQGINTGREESKKENAKAMKDLGLDAELIMKVTGLNRESVDTL